MTHRYILPSAPRLLGWFVALFLLGPSVAAAQMGGISYTISPAVEGVFWPDQAALEETAMYGGELGLGFGRYVELSGVYMLNGGVSSDLNNIGSLAGLSNRSVDVQRYGGTLRFNLPATRLRPYLEAGVGVLQFDPDAKDTYKSIYASGGAGLTFTAASRYTVTVGGGLLTYRYTPSALFFDANDGIGDTGQRTVYSPTLRAAVRLYLGGRRPGTTTALDQSIRGQFGDGLSGARLFVKPFYGRVEFNEALGFPKDQNLYGVNAGVQLGQYLGLYGFYWRGADGTAYFEDIGGGTDAVALYGGEMALRVDVGALGQRFVPYLTMGGGYFNVLSGYANDVPAGAALPTDRYFASGGLGLEVPLVRSLRLTGGLRGLVMSTEEASTVSNPGEVYGSLMYSVGVEFSLGGGREAPQPPRRPQPPVAPLPANAPAAATPQAPAPAGRAPTAATTPSTPDTVRVAQAARSPAPTASSNLSDRTIAVPVPEVGEIYIRIGNPDAASPAGGPPTTAAAPAPDQPLEARVRQALRAELGADTTATTAASIEQMVQQAVREYLRTTEGDAPTADEARIQALEEQIAALERQLERQTQALNALGANVRPIQVQTTTTTATEEGDTQPFYRSVLGQPLLEIMPYTGARFGQGLTQVQIGVRGNYRSSPSSNFQLMPELAVGLRDGTSVLALMNAGYSFLGATVQNQTGQPIEPYAGIGLGLLTRTGIDVGLASNVFLGGTYKIGGGGVVLEYSTLNLFDYHRLTIGYRILL
ncbi:hypothetical protein [Salisaeta longa]|uniref:hypothetical protein n=1 Tax=Salisaeta longa TaxID=503170 RepID=UPI0012F7495D|nr:hypothetical protein [Salisaeta longa]